jgi:hypothetical protein
MIRDRRNAGVALAGALLLGVPMVDLLVGGAFGGVHAMLGVTGIAFLVTTLMAGEV